MISARPSLSQRDFTEGFAKNIKVTVQLSVKLIKFKGKSKLTTKYTLFKK